MTETTLTFDAQDNAREVAVWADATAGAAIALTFWLSASQASGIEWWAWVAEMTSAQRVRPAAAPPTWRSGEDVLRALNSGVRADHALTRELDERAATIADVLGE